MTVETPPPSPPQDPPDEQGCQMAIDNPQKNTYSKALRNKLPSSFNQYLDLASLQNEEQIDLQEDAIKLTAKDKARLYTTWRNSVIIKVPRKSSIAYFRTIN